MSHTLDQAACNSSPESLCRSTERKQIQYTVGKEDVFVKALGKLDKVELKKLLQTHQDGALNTSKKLAEAFTAAATGFLDNSDDGGDYDIIDISDSDSTLDDSEEDSAYDTEDDSSIDSDDGEYQYTQIYDDDDAPTEDGDDSTFIEDDSDEQSNYSTVIDDVQTIVKCFHALMQKILEHNSASCLIQFVLNKQDGKQNDGPSLIQAMLPWTFSFDDRVEANILLELDNLLLVARKS